VRFKVVSLNVAKLTTFCHGGLGRSLELRNTGCERFRVELAPCFPSSGKSGVVGIRVVYSENERQLLVHHMMNPSPPIMWAGSGWFRRTPSRIAFRLQFGSSQLLHSQVRAMDFASANKVDDHLRLTLGDSKPPEDKVKKGEERCFWDNVQKAP
jgi:hypothetical protein